MKRAIPTILAAAVLLGGCSALTESGDGLSAYEKAADLVRKGDALSDEAAKKLAIGADAYCTQPTDAISKAARDWVRTKVNAALLAMNSRVRMNDFCKFVEPAPAPE